MKKQDITKLVSETGAPCISITVPMKSIFSNKEKEPKIISHAKELLKQKYNKSSIDIGGLIEKIDGLVEQIEYGNTNEGIVIYVSETTAKFFNLPFPVTEKVRIKSNFEIRNLLRYQNLMFDYYVVAVSKKNIHMFKGNGNTLVEIKNKEFPIHYQDDYEYEKPSRANSYSSSILKDYEKDKSVIQEIRLVDFLKKVDYHLNTYLNGETPLIISGGTKEIADFLSITQHQKNIIGKVKGNYIFNGNSQLASLSWDQIKSHLKKENDRMLAEAKELVGEGMMAVGLKETWKAANEGKGLKLFLEKDFEKPGYISNNGYDLKLRKPIGNRNYIYDNDVVERVIRLVTEKKGKIVFVEKGELTELDKIALQLRYNVNKD